MSPRTTQPLLFCKPAPTGRMLCSRFFPGLPGRISFRSLQLKKDLPILHEWVTADYAHRFWQMDGPFKQFYETYQAIEKNPFAHSFVGLLGDRLICQLDVYSVLADELAEYIPTQLDDAGFHLLMAPNGEPLKGLSAALVKTFLSWYFSFAQAVRIYAEPDVANTRACALLDKCGFTQLRRVQMKQKEAFIYCLQRNNASTKF